MAADPIERFQRWQADAGRAGVDLSESIALATADRRGRPSLRYVLLKSVDRNGFVFYTNARSRKGRELTANPHAALAVYWHEIDRQVRIEGPVREVTREEADAYWAERPRDSQIASAASQQSRTIQTRAALLAACRDVERRWRGREIPRPARWTGYRLLPRRIEFWTRCEPRLHRRELFERKGSRWVRTLLQP